METVLVTGGAGFIGSWLCDLLVERGYRVICLDNLSSGNRENISHLLPNPNFHFLKGDVIGPPEIPEVDYIFHMASRASPVDFKEYSLEILLANSIGTKNMLEIAQKNNARFLLASSSEVYGNPLQHPQREDYWGNVNPIGIRAPYDESKRFAEALSMAFHRRYNLDVRIARIFNTYGPRMRQDDGRVIPTFITQALRGDQITVYGDGSQTRSFCYVSDLVDGLTRLMFKDGLSGEVFNLGNPHEISILEVAKLIKKLTNSTSEITFRPLPKDDPVRRRPDISKARELLGWVPKTELENGLRETIRYFEKILLQQ
ncbi:MAG: UDP-glucuronic acid decarboxylase family protein [Candidatus Hadarchaeales archaeon]